MKIGIVAGLDVVPPASTSAHVDGGTLEETEIAP